MSKVEIGEDKPNEKSKSSELAIARVGHHRQHFCRHSKAGRGVGKLSGGEKEQLQVRGSWRWLLEAGMLCDWLREYLAFSGPKLEEETKMRETVNY